MVKAKAHLNGKEVLVLGLSFGNLDKFKSEPLDTFILIDGKEFGIPLDIMIVSGKTEDEIVGALNLTPGATVIDLRKLS